MENKPKWGGFKNFQGEKYIVRIYTEDDSGTWPDTSIIDVDIIIDDLEKYTGIICTVRGIEQLMAKDKITGENEWGSYLSITNLLIVSKFEINFLLKTFQIVIHNKEIQQIFSRVK